MAIASAHVYPVYPGWLEQLLKPFGDPRVALTYGKQRGDATTRFSEHQVFAKCYPEISNANQDHPFCNNANAAIRKSLWLTRPYDESLPGLEDLEWAGWAMGQGYRVAYVAEAETIHVHEETLRQVHNRCRREAMALKRIRPEESFRLADPIRLFLVNVANDAWHARRKGRLRQSLGGIIGCHWAQFWGTYRGFRIAGSLARSLKQAFYNPPGSAKPPVLSRHDLEAIDYGQEPCPSGNGPAARSAPWCCYTAVPSAPRHRTADKG